jgi:phosphohistidine phosphatase SixA
MRTRLIRCFLVAFLLGWMACSAPAQTTVFLVRHAEKSDDPGTKDDPNLSAAGQERAKALAKVLQHAEIAAIYVSDRKRTQQTAQPLAEMLKTTPVILSQADTNLLPAKLKTATGNVLIVGHSNTVPQLLEALGVPKVTIDDNDYDNLFVVLLAEKPRLIRLHYP